jgi:RimJ/RimL family protein N-acetyltransferase
VPDEPLLKTERLLLRRWLRADLDPLAAMNGDPEVMRYFPACLDREESALMMARNNAHFERYGFGWWVVEIRDVAPFTGFAGLFAPSFHAHFTPCIEVGWRLVRTAWGKGFATEAGRACLAFAFDRLVLNEVVSFTTVANGRSRQVMERLGMTRQPADDFGHPRLPFDHPQRPHVLYRLPRQALRPAGGR